MKELIMELENMVINEPNLNIVKNQIKKIYDKYLESEATIEKLKVIQRDCDSVRDRQHQRIRLLEGMLQVVIDKEVI